MVVLCQCSGVCRLFLGKEIILPSLLPLSLLSGRKSVLPVESVPLMLNQLLSFENVEVRNQLKLTVPCLSVLIFKSRTMLNTADSFIPWRSDGWASVRKAVSKYCCPTTVSAVLFSTLSPQEPVFWWPAYYCPTPVSEVLFFALSPQEPVFWWPAYYCPTPVSEVLFSTLSPQEPVFWWPAHSSGWGHRAGVQSGQADGKLCGLFVAVDGHPHHLPQDAAGNLPGAGETGWCSKV